MKILLLICNVFLTLLAAWSIYSLFADSSEIVYQVGKPQSKTETTVQDAGSGNTGTATAFPAGEALSSLISSNVFALSRCPTLVMSAQTLTLVGVFTSGNISGATIIQTNAQNPAPPWMQQNRGNQSSAPRQATFFIGDRINDQYTLVAVTATTATLSGPIGTRVLELQKPSAVQSASGNRNQGFQPGMMPQWNPWMMGGGRGGWWQQNQGQPPAPGGWGGNRGGGGFGGWGGNRGGGGPGGWGGRR